MKSKLPFQKTDLEDAPYWNKMRSHDYSKSFDAVKVFIHQQSAIMNKRKERKNRIRLMLIIALLPLMVLLSCKRNNYVQSQGATLSFTTNNSLVNQIDQVVRQYADKEWRVVFRPHGGTLRAVISTSAKQYEKLKEVADKLKAIPGISELYMSSIATAIKEPVLSRLSYKLFNWHFNAIDISDEQLRIAIQSKLMEIGQQGLQLQVVKESGRRQVNIASSNRVSNFSIQLTLSDGSNITAQAEKW